MNILREPILGLRHINSILLGSEPFMLGLKMVSDITV